MNTNPGLSGRAQRALRVTVALLAAAWLSGPVSAQQTVCDRACLVAQANAYFAALKAHNAQGLPQAAKARITENGAERKLAETLWAGAGEAVYRFDVVNPRRGDVASEAVIRNADGSKTMFMVRLKVLAGAITEIETIKANKGEADRLWDPDTLTRVSPALPSFWERYSAR